MLIWVTAMFKKINSQFLTGIIFQSLVLAHTYSEIDAQEIKIGLFPDRHISSVVFGNVDGHHSLYADGTFLSQSAPGDLYYAFADNNKIHLSNSIRKIGNFSKLELRHTGNESTFQLKPVSPVLFSADYDGDLVLIPDGNLIHIINKINLEKYVAAVIEAEGGSNAPLEYYKAQAILIRTYAIKNMYRHGAENYNLCSSVHCQAYKGRSMLNRQIYEAALLTNGMVITDKDSNLITAPYHSNCGGMTSSADIAWQTNLPCLVSVKDPFCVAGKNHSWSKHVSVENWARYLSSYGIKTEELPIDHYLLSNQGRIKTYMVNKTGIPMRKIREDLNLKSSYFQIQQYDGTHLIIRGRGFGHGIGLCQEGAMEMAKAGYTYPDIIHFYFQNVLIVNYDKIPKQQ